MTLAATQEANKSTINTATAFEGVDMFGNRADQYIYYKNIGFFNGEKHISGFSKNYGNLSLKVDETHPAIKGLKNLYGHDHLSNNGLFTVLLTLQLDIRIDYTCYQVDCPRNFKIGFFKNIASTEPLFVGYSENFSTSIPTLSLLRLGSEKGYLERFLEDLQQEQDRLGEKLNTIKQAVDVMKTFLSPPKEDAAVGNITAGVGTSVGGVLTFVAEQTPQIPKAHKDVLADDQPQTRSFLTAKSAQGTQEGTVGTKLIQALEANADELTFGDRMRRQREDFESGRSSQFGYHPV